MDEIRVTYSGLIAFSISLMSVVTGMVFVLIVTRRLSPEEFGLWTILGSLISYVVIYEPIISYWVSREIARGKEVGKTALATSGSFSIVSFVTFLVIIFFFSSLTNSDYNVLFLAAFLVPLTFVSNTLAGINLGHKPQAISFGLLFFEIFKIPVALGTVYFLELGIYGAIIATIVAFIAKIAIQLYFARPKLGGIISIQKIKYWLKFSWLPLYGIFPSFIWTLDVIIFTSITGSVVGLAYYGAAMAIGNVVIHAGMISQGLYPKLLAGGKTEYIKSNFAKLLFFAIPLLTIVILFNKAGLFILNPLYEDAYLIVTLFSIWAFFSTIMNTFNKTLQGLEKVDEKEMTKFSLLVKSKLFLVPSLRLIQYTSYIVGLTIMLIILTPQGLSDIELIQWWITISLIIQIPFTVISIILVYRKTKFHFPGWSILKYSIGALGMILVYFLTYESIIIYEKSIFIFLPRLLLEVVICSGVYLGITYLIDKNIRSFLKAVLVELSSNRSK